ncbi:hypothetical protein DY000_02030711 [Brassica cretica]|uniref:Uncharacterized protein n=1 Tax=Brassica cretica TaxID=69181 RepID=A0ABQ7DG13_BRACR|nr:hypothetical protein DY000_02030711 [Brassica cretica]
MKIDSEVWFPPHHFLAQKWPPSLTHVQATPKISILQSIASISIYSPFREFGLLHVACSYWLTGWVIWTNGLARFEHIGKNRLLPAYLDLLVERLVFVLTKLSNMSSNALACPKLILIRPYVFYYPIMMIEIEYCLKCRPWKFSMLDHDAFVAQILSLRSNLIFARPFFKTPRPSL